MGEEFCGFEVIGVVSDLRTGFINDNEQMKDYVLQRDCAANSLLKPRGDDCIKDRNIDKFKFVPAISRTWRMRPEKRWYLFFVDDTYMV